MDKIRSPTSMSMQPQNLSVSMAGTPGTPMVTFLFNVSSTSADTVDYLKIQNIFKSHLFIRYILFHGT